MPVLERYQVDTVVFREVDVETEVYEYWLQLLEAKGATVYQGETGLHVTLDEGLEMVVLHPGTDRCSLLLFYKEGRHVLQPQRPARPRQAGDHLWTVPFSCPAHSMAA